MQSVGFHIQVKPAAASKRTTSQSVRDYEQLKYRWTCLGSKVELVSDYLKGLYGHNVTAVTLLSGADKLEKMIGIQVDRLARRNRQALLCWYAENWEIIQPILFGAPYMKSPCSTNDDSYKSFYDISCLLNYH